MVRRLAFLLLGLPLLVAGGFGIAASLAPKLPALDAVRGLLDAVAPLVGSNARALELQLAGSPIRFGLAGGGLLLLVLALLPGRRAKAEEREPDVAVISRKALRKTKRAAARAARKGQYAEAGEICFHSGLLEKAAEYFEKGEDLPRAAEILHTLKQYDRCADLYVRAGDHQTAGTLYASQEKFDRAADCYLKAGRTSVAAEMFEKAGQFAKAGECYVQCSFHRQAAGAYVKAKAWDRAAHALEEVVNEETLRSGAGQSPERDREVRTLVLQCAKLYEQARDLAAALRVLERGECFKAAAEMALRLPDPGKAAELFLAAREPQRAAEALRQAGRGEEAARVLGEHLRDKGNHADAARSLEEAGEHMAAGDLYRQLEDFGRAAACYERGGDLAQAAEMYRLAGDLPRSAELFGQFGQWGDAAACWAEAGEALRQAEALARATRFLAAGEIYQREGRPDEAIEVLQQIDAQSADFAAASAILGEIFLARGEHALAVAKLEQAVGGREPSRDDLEAHYRLAVALEETGRAAEAASRFEKILAVGYRYQDSEARLAACREKAAAAAPPASAAGAAESSATRRPTRYKVLGELGRGGMGIVYKAQDTVLDRTVALKVLPEALRENEQALQNFLREAKSAAKLNHPNIVTVYDAGEQDGRFYIAMEFVDGTTLKEILKRKGPIAAGGVLNVLLQMCEALGYAHEQRVVHRDVKTANTMWTRDRKAKIMDFGLAKVVEEVRNHTTIVSGTPYYMSPEQTLGKNVDHRTDIYSLGVTIFELATGAVPFREGNIPYHHVHTPPPDPRQLNPELPALLVQVIAKCLQKDPAARFQSTREISALVKEALARSGRASS
jgi:tetratricopeptide (TPR) repeat protein